MKRTLLAFLILAVGSTVFCALKQSTDRVQAQALKKEQAIKLQNQLLTQLQTEQRTLSEKFSQTRQLLTEQAPASALPQLAGKILSGVASTNLSPVESEQLLAELGLNWNTTGEYVIVSKKSLDGISFAGLTGTQLTSVAKAALAITPTEAAAIEAMTRQLGDARDAWEREQVQRTEPSGDVLAQYTLPSDPDLARQQLSAFTNGIVDALGTQRAKWLQEHSLQWMMDFGLLTGPEASDVPAAYQSAFADMISQHQHQPTVLTLKRYQAGSDDRISFSLQQAGNTMSTDVNPWQPFPQAFRGIFPGGWADLAQREDFELPKSFQKK